MACEDYRNISSDRLVKVVEVDAIPCRIILHEEKFMCYRLHKICTLTLAMSLLVIASMGCTRGSHESQMAADEAASVSSSKSNPSPVSAVEKQITIDNFSFDPPMLTVSAGTKVTWINHDDVPHTATSISKPKRFDSKTLDTDQKFSHVFTTPGTYEYFCAIHPKMTGKIIVSEPAPKTSP